MGKIVGGVFGLEAVGASSTLPPYSERPHVNVVNGRSAIFMAMNAIAPSTVWLPSYLCLSILDSLRESDASISYYPVTNDLQLVSDRWLDDISENDSVLVIDYFGFPADRQFLKQIRETGAWILLDACQSLFAVPEPESVDFTVYSPRKFVGVPDGGVLTFESQRARALDIDTKPLDPPPDDWLNDAIRAVTLRKNFDDGATDRSWYDLFSRSESTAPTGPIAMSDVSKSTLLDAIDFADVGAKRRANFATLAETLEEIALFPTLPDEVVPLGFPVRLAERDAVRHALFEKDIYPPVHWPLGDAVPTEFSESHRLQDEIMTIPCDQRHDQNDMRRVADALRDSMHVD